ncbi:lactate dehydrogenase [Endozoicomonas montiporae]|uniref:L-lactate dehydrogenase n=2 Tax=Endozoicomonas montiporae TaxID=1027273 RepID=A0A081N8P7_9GAMM|nr:L-lactate dehydrogenase [Endozoicomonas montiporae]AMO55276.1 L-lactate dehydrogenase [Endozoicomonas montiporae CL-33]KEQ14820.1 lactate dehydrogenase [Endozoicomonas montiporae]
MMDIQKIGIIGTGYVGMAAAFAIFQQQLATELVLIDKNVSRAEGEALDLMHGQPLVGRCTVRAGDFEDLEGAGLVIICAGVSQSSPDENRLDLLKRNISVFEMIARELDRYAPNALLLIASNPVDILTQAMQCLSARPRQLIIGTGTYLDTSRFRTLLAQYYDVSPNSVHAYILGEHGDSEIAVWSSAAIGGLPVQENTINGREFDVEKMDTLFCRVKNAAYDIIASKGHTNWAIGLVIAGILRTIRDDQRRILPVSVRLEGEYGIENVCLSIPTIVGSQGIENHILPDLNEDELKGLRLSAQTLLEPLEALNLTH